MIRRRKRREDSGKSGVFDPILMEEEDDDKDEDRNEDDSDDDAMTTIKTMRGKRMDWFRACSERDPRQVGRGSEYAYANESDKDYSSVIVAKDNTYGEKYDVKFTDVNGKKTHFQMGDVLGGDIAGGRAPGDEDARVVRADVGNSGTLLKSSFGGGNRWARSSHAGEFRAGEEF